MSDFLGVPSAACSDARPRARLLPHCMDRASANFPALRRVSRKLAAQTLSPRIFARAGGSFLRVCALVRNRPSVGKDLLDSVVSFARLLRSWKAAGSWRSELLVLAAAKLQISPGLQPEAVRRTNALFQSALLGKDGCHLRRSQREPGRHSASRAPATRGQRRPTQLSRLRPGRFGPSLRRQSVLHNPRRCF